MFRCLFSLLFILGLAGCASLDRQACLEGDWYQIGMDDGVLGRSVTQQQKHSVACSEYGVSVQVTAYLRGHAEGLKQYCTLEGGYRAGLNGSAYLGVCPEESEGAFLKAYRSGRHEARLRCLNEYHFEWFYDQFHYPRHRHHHYFPGFMPFYCY